MLLGRLGAASPNPSGGQAHPQPIPPQRSQGLGPGSQPGQVEPWLWSLQDWLLWSGLSPQFLVLDPLLCSVMTSGKGRAWRPGSRVRLRCLFAGSPGGASPACCD